MNCTKIHEGLLQKEIRDFLSQQMVLAFEAEGKNQKVITNHCVFSDTFEWAKHDALEQIKYLRKYIVNIENKQAILKLIENSGWKEHDVSDDVHNDTNHKYSMNFIGTEKEYKSLINGIYGKKK